MIGNKTNHTQILADILDYCTVHCLEIIELHNSVSWSTYEHSSVVSYHKDHLITEPGFKLCCDEVAIQQTPRDTSVTNQKVTFQQWTKYFAVQSMQVHA